MHNDYHHTTKTLNKRGEEIWVDEDGKLHRPYSGPFRGPAHIDSKGTSYWYIHGQLSRNCDKKEIGSGAAIIYYDEKGYSTDQYWYSNGKLHNDFGPAILLKDGTKKWYIEGVEITDKESHVTRQIRISRNNNEKWFDEEGKLHRPSKGPFAGPAVVKHHKGKWWYKHGKLHNDENGNCSNNFAIESVSPEYKAWYIDGKLHNLNGPAYVAYKKGGEKIQEWWANGIKLTDPDDFVTRKIEKNIFGSGFTRIWCDQDGKTHRPETGPMRGPAVMCENGHTMWFKHGQNHRNPDETTGGGPAIEKGNDKYWFVDQYPHNPFGPAKIEYLYSGIRKEWYWKGIKITDSERFSTRTFDEEGNEKWIDERGKLHRQFMDGPAFTSKNGVRIWYHHGEKILEENNIDADVDITKLKLASITIDNNSSECEESNKRYREINIKYLKNKNKLKRMKQEILEMKMDNVTNEIKDMIVSPKCFCGKVNTSNKQTVLLLNDDNIEKHHEDNCSTGTDKYELKKIQNEFF